jgi:hypothetical protein
MRQPLISPMPADWLTADLQLLVTEYGAQAIGAALDKMPNEPWPSVSLH